MPALKRAATERRPMTRKMARQPKRSAIKAPMIGPSAGTKERMEPRRL
jgi:hypothetical protein